jgi:octaprenyl-diphosphate synthase
MHNKNADISFVYDILTAIKENDELSFYSLLLKNNSINIDSKLLERILKIIKHNPKLKDDIFDYGDGDKIGKPTGLDIRERKITLPLIYTLNNCSKEIKKELVYIIKNKNEDQKFIKRAIQLVHETGGIEFSKLKIIELRDEALSKINHIEDSPAKKALIGLVNYTIERSK